MYVHMAANILKSAHIEALIIALCYYGGGLVYRLFVYLFRFAGAVEWWP